MQRDIARRYRWHVMQAVAAERLVAIVRADSYERARELVEALLAGGLRVIEITLTTPGALRLLEEFRGRALLGAGTVLSGGQVAAVAQAGGEFVVTPNVEPDVIRHASRHGLASFVGCATPTEAVAALELGADAIKLFPAGSLGIGFARALHAPIPWAPLVPTGGVGLANAAEWLDAGAVALGVGGSLCEGSLDDVTAKASAWRDFLNARAAADPIH